MKSLTEHSAPPKQLKTLKREVGYTDKEVSKTHARLNQMAIDEPMEKANELGEKQHKSRETNLD